MVSSKTWDGSFDDQACRARRAAKISADFPAGGKLKGAVDLRNAIRNGEMEAKMPVTD
jgi:hypothetical protein